ncbi:response regulator [Aquibium sp. ELW1220]|uniref:response regulator n=1 Tax=Aquibium sp. ELW1220 TaxID=2976766 RepID=UPI0025B1575F|nr:response regulator [Aquibium sp. ELW1220]MDN2582133.1 response regulator [Aquibium sp. ELW1220]
MPMVVKKRVLIVEDEWFIADDLARLLADAGYEVLGPAPRVDVAIALIDAGDVDAGLLDVSLRDDTSLPVAERLRADGVPFAFLTAYAEISLPGGFEDVALIGKPAAPAELLEVLSRLVAKD